MLRRMSSLARWAALALTLLLIAIIVAADRGALPDFARVLYRFPGGDKAGHVLLFGGLAFLVTLGFVRRDVRIDRVQVPAGALLLAAIVTLEEASQPLFAGRTFSLADLAAS